MTNPMTERISQHYADLTQNNRRIADYLLVNPEKILMLSTNEIAQECSVSKASVSRFIRKLGYQDHSCLRSELLGERDKGTPMATLSDATGLTAELSALESLWAQIDSVDLEPVIDALMSSKKVKVIGYRNSYPVAMHFRQQLLQCRQHIELLPLPGQTIGEDIASIDEQDFIVLIGIRRRVNGFAELIEQLPSHRTLLITDQTGIHYQSQAACTLVCPMSNERSLDSYAAPMALISYLSNRVYDKLGSKAVKVSESVSQTYSVLNELE
ncbi:MurR/RpiR family transcriptional regulator [uncultured Vibrio sp.]|uniref:MurR/RpiR family transcriptional regulator n=1 Tax=uncultured Vibrio sp. TaxID=114054 RepID=UPI0025EF69A1|nr:MurR/RpiR family transcriptional regulator [uncultured Vibrio sp.]